VRSFDAAEDAFAVSAGFVANSAPSIAVEWIGFDVEDRMVSPPRTA